MVKVLRDKNITDLNLFLKRTSLTTYKGANVVKIVELINDDEFKNQLNDMMNDLNKEDVEDPQEHADIPGRYSMCGAYATAGDIDSLKLKELHQTEMQLKINQNKTYSSVISQARNGIL